MVRAARAGRGRRRLRGLRQLGSLCLRRPRRLGRAHAGAPARGRRRLPRPRRPSARPASSSRSGRRRRDRSTPWSGWRRCARPWPTTSPARGWEAAVDSAYAEPFARLRPPLEALPQRPLHGDWQTNNLFFSGDEVCGIIDFHQADFGPRVLDLAVAVERNCFFWNRISAGDDTAFDLRQAELLVRATTPRRRLSRSSGPPSPTSSGCASSSTGSRSSTTTGAWSATARRPTGRGTVRARPRPLVGLAGRPRRPRGDQGVVGERHPVMLAV